MILRRALLVFFAAMAIASCGASSPQKIQLLARTHSYQSPEGQAVYAMLSKEIGKMDYDELGAVLFVMPNTAAMRVRSRSTLEPEVFMLIADRALMLAIEKYRYSPISHEDALRTLGTTFMGHTFLLDYIGTVVNREASYAWGSGKKEEAKNLLLLERECRILAREVAKWKRA